MKNIAIALDDGKAAQRNSITNFFSSRGWAYWHWVDDFWIVQVPDRYTAKLLQVELRELPDVGTSTMLAFEFEGKIRYWGWNKPSAWEWLSNIGSAG